MEPSPSQMSEFENSLAAERELNRAVAKKRFNRYLDSDHVALSSLANKENLGTVLRAGDILSRRLKGVDKVFPHKTMLNLPLGCHYCVYSKQVDKKTHEVIDKSAIQADRPETVMKVRVSTHDLLTLFYLVKDVRFPDTLDVAEFVLQNKCDIWYHATLSNCEHFVTFCLTRFTATCTSKQGRLPGDRTYSFNIGLDEGKRDSGLGENTYKKPVVKNFFADLEQNSDESSKNKESLQPMELHLSTTDNLFLQNKFYIGAYKPREATKTRDNSPPVDWGVWIEHNKKPCLPLLRKCAIRVEKPTSLTLKREQCRNKAKDLLKAYKASRTPKLLGAVGSTQNLSGYLKPGDIVFTETADFFVFIKFDPHKKLFEFVGKTAKSNTPKLVVMPVLKLYDEFWIVEGVRHPHTADVAMFLMRNDLDAGYDPSYSNSEHFVVFCLTRCTSDIVNAHTHCAIDHVVRVTRDGVANVTIPVGNFFKGLGHMLSKAGGTSGQKMHYQNKCVQTSVPFGMPSDKVASGEKILIGDISHRNIWGYWFDNDETPSFNSLHQLESEWDIQDDRIRSNYYSKMLH